MKKNISSGACGQTTNRLRSGSIQIEVLIALGVLMVALLSFTQTVTKGIVHQGAVQEREHALAAARQTIENLRAENFTEVFVRYNDTQADDPGSGVSPGSNFSVAGLRPLDNAPDGQVGQIRFPVLGNALREDLDRPELGLPFDLNRDGGVGSDDIADSYLLLPVEVRIDWRSSGSEQSLRLFAWLGAIQ